MDIKRYLREVMVPVLKVAMAAPVIPLAIYIQVPMGETASFLAIGILCVVSVGMCAYVMGCTQKEKSVITSKLRK